MSTTWFAKLPWTWWFFPWTSDAMAPPTVTWRVPGITGSQRPNPRSIRIKVSRLTPASTVTRARSRSTVWM